MNEGIEIKVFPRSDTQQKIIEAYQRILNELKSNTPEIRQIRNLFIYCNPEDKFLIKTIVNSGYAPCAPGTMPVWNEIKAFWDIDIRTDIQVKPGEWEIRYFSKEEIV
jgi:hypothetical protein